MSVTARTTGVDETRKLAGAVAPMARPGDVILLAGDLGAGKTAFVQGFAIGLGITEHVTSPTFTLARHYEGRLVLHHIDVYRLEQMEEVFDIGLPELLDEGAVTVIEWGDAIAPALPADYLEIRLRFEDHDDDGAAWSSGANGDAADQLDDVRTLTLRAVGPSWAARNRAVVAAIEPWLTGDSRC